ncbi:zinc-dependent metalloprotease [Rhodococcus sp. X156]|uniref:zinc-dependent metalloprotease n=1 Tax=Rhodococcus sp. X156 TaxID=2499145 RepID=UPI000FDC4518|nr:zinc-dependent metalloprotease [Rhodococcus sp. X156]
MSNLPFGFSGSGDDSGDDDERGKRSSDNPFGFGGGGAGGFDPAALGQMLTQFGQMLSNAGSSSGPVNYDLARQLAEQQLGPVPALKSGESDAVRDALRLAELWLDDVTPLPAGFRQGAAWTAKDWLSNTMPTWQRLCDPVATKMAGAWVEGLPDEAKQMLGPMMGMMSQMGGMAFGSQLGQALGQLSKEVLSSTDIGLPLGPEGTAALLPQAIATFTEGLDRPDHEVMVYLAAREAAHHRLFAHVPWLRQRMLATVEEYANGITVDFSAMEEMARNLDPATLGDPAALEQALSQGTFGPTTSPAQKAALQRLETLLALVEGWVDHVVSDAVHNRLPGADALRETLRRRRASGGPAEQTFATLVGLELRPRRLREAAELWRVLAERSDAATRDAVWAHPDLLPSSDDLDDPVAFAERFLMSRTSGSDNPMEELERTMARESEEAARKDEPGEDDGDAGDGPNLQK